MGLPVPLAAADADSSALGIGAAARCSASGGDARRSAEGMTAAFGRADVSHTYNRRAGGSICVLVHPCPQAAAGEISLAACGVSGYRGLAQRGRPPPPQPRPSPSSARAHSKPGGGRLEQDGRRRPSTSSHSRVLLPFQMGARVRAFARQGRARAGRSRVTSVAVGRSSSSMFGRRCYVMLVIAGPFHLSPRTC